MPFDKRMQRPLLCLAVAAFAAAWSVFPIPVHPRQGRSRVQGAKHALRGFLRVYVSELPASDRRATEYFSGFVNLTDGGAEDVIVYLMGDGWCGSGGCTTLVLAPDNSSYRIVSKITITWPPIRVLATKSHGWHDIAVWVQGGGIQPGYEARLSFNGKSYPTNPSVPPARPLVEKIRGEVVVPSTAKGMHLY